MNNDLTLALVVIVALWPSTSQTASTTPATPWPPRSPRAPCRLASRSCCPGRSTWWAPSVVQRGGHHRQRAGEHRGDQPDRGPGRTLCGGITWNLLTWYFGIPSSSSHALIGGVVGATIAAAGSHAVKWHGLVSKVIIPGVLSPFIALGIAAVGTWWVYRLTKGVPKGTRPTGSGSGRSARPPWCRWPTAPTTPRRPWASSPWP